MTPQARASYGPLSWQQEAGLVREAAYGRYTPVRRVFAIPEAVSDDEFASRLACLAGREDALHLVGATLDGGGTASYRDEIELPLRHLVCGEKELRRAATAPVGLPRDGGPLWEVTVLHGPDGSRYASCVFDHLISDGYSARLFEGGLTGVRRVGRTGTPGGYQAWVAWQRREFPRHGGAGAARDFWLRHLDGTPADRATPLPFARDAAAGQPGLATTMHLDLPVTFGDLRVAGRALRATPFHLVFATVISEVSRLSGSEDITVRVAGTGRPPSHAGTLGWFADAFPVRVRADGIDDPHRVLELARPLTARMLDGPATAPWEYIRGLSPRAGAGAGDATRQIMLNLAPDAAQPFAEAEGERTGPGSVDALHLFVKTTADGRCRLMALVDHGAFSPDGARSFLRRLAEGLTAVARTGRTSLSV